MFYTSVISLQQICENGFICICVRNKLVLDESCIQMYNVKWLYLHLGQIELFMMYILTVLVVLQDALIRLVHLFHSSISNLAIFIPYTIARSNVNHSVLITCCFVYFVCVCIVCVCVTVCVCVFYDIHFDTNCIFVSLLESHFDKFFNTNLAHHRQATPSRF